LVEFWLRLWKTRRIQGEKRMMKKSDSFSV